MSDIEQVQERARELIYGAVERLLAACESDADLEKLPAQRDFIEREVQAIDEGMKAFAGPGVIAGFEPGRGMSS